MGSFKVQGFFTLHRLWTFSVGNKSKGHVSDHFINWRSTNFVIRLSYRLLSFFKNFFSLTFVKTIFDLSVLTFYSTIWLRINIWNAPQSEWSKKNWAEPHGSEFSSTLNQILSRHFFLFPNYVFVTWIIHASHNFLLNTTSFLCEFQMWCLLDSSMFFIKMALIFRYFGLRFRSRAKRTCVHRQRFCYSSALRRHRCRCSTGCVNFLKFSYEAWNWKNKAFKRCFQPFCSNLCNQFHSEPLLTSMLGTLVAFLTSLWIDKLD